MSRYRVVINKSAEKELIRLPLETIVRIREKISSLADDPRPDGCKKLKGYKDLYRIRVSDYRVIYSINDGLLIITVLAVGNRKDIYS
ncbi:MAG: type II toxin-antitoxin system RelE/ParE family toxin [Bacteroidetes bacterium]|nr:type II toxin-antitoxin system RelE/ParE family toxin [Fibrella sp.]